MDVSTDHTYRTLLTVWINIKRRDDMHREDASGF